MGNQPIKQAGEDKDGAMNILPACCFTLDINMANTMTQTMAQIMTQTMTKTMTGTIVKTMAKTKTMAGTVPKTPDEDNGDVER